MANSRTQGQGRASSWCEIPFSKWTEHSGFRMLCIEIDVHCAEDFGDRNTLARSGNFFLLESCH